MHKTCAIFDKNGGHHKALPFQEKIELDEQGMQFGSDFQTG